jgi:phosphatidylinositol glycan class Z
MTVFGLLTTIIAVYADTAFYSSGATTMSSIFYRPVITPLNNLRYNFSTSNLAKHGLHPYYQHLVVNLPQLLGPAYPLLFLLPHLSLRLASAVSGVLVLSLFQHQEARFLIPTIPLILSSIELPRKHARYWIGAWIGFNSIFGIIMGLYHQGGVIPAQIFLSTREDAAKAFWWRTYSPPIWLLDHKNKDFITRDLMGMKPESMLTELQRATFSQCDKRGSENVEKDVVYLIAPKSSTWLDTYTNPTEEDAKFHPLYFEQVWQHRRHLNLDDLDIGEDGVWRTLRRVIGRRGLVIWKVTRNCVKL